MSDRNFFLSATLVNKEIQQMCGNIFVPLVYKYKGSLNQFPQRSISLVQSIRVLISDPEVEGSSFTSYITVAGVSVLLASLYMLTFRREHFSPDFEGPFRPSRQLSKSSACEKNKVPKNLDLHFAINISGNSPFGTPALMENAERYEW